MKDSKTRPKSFASTGGAELIVERRVDRPLADVPDQDLREMALNFEELSSAGKLRDDAPLREAAKPFGPGIMGLTATALHVFREIAKRADLY